MSDLRSVIAVAILAGGNSRRMGEDKAALVEAHQSLISHQVLDLRRVLPALPVFVCAGSRRYPELCLTVFIMCQTRSMMRAHWGEL